MSTTYPSVTNLKSEIDALSGSKLAWFKSDVLDILQYIDSRLSKEDWQPVKETREKKVKDRANRTRSEVLKNTQELLSGKIDAATFEKRLRDLNS